MDMNYMRRFYSRAGALLLALLLCLSLSVPALAAEGQTLEDTAREAATAAMTFGGAGSISWAVWQEGEILESGAMGAEGAPAVKDGVYGVGSVSKIYTTAAVMQLVEMGKLELDRPVTAYLPAFKMADARYKDITVRMLLNHSSGLMGSSMGSGILFDDPSGEATDRLLERLAVQRLKADPGAYSVYCNDGFTLAELVVEAVSGQDFMDYVRSGILKPAGLTHTYSPGDDFSGRADIYQAGDDRPLPMDCLGIIGTGGIYATAEDLAAFGGALTGTDILTQPSLDAMAAPEYDRGLWPEDSLDALAFGLGWDNVEWFPFSQSGIQALVKGGDTQYYHAGLVIIPEYDLSAAVLSSGGVSTYNEMAASQMLVRALADKGITVDETPPALPEAVPEKMPGELLDYAGYYGSILQYQVDIDAGGQLTMRYLNRPDIPDAVFTYYSDGTFRDENNRSLLRLVEEDNGEVYLYQKAFSNIPGLGGLGTSNYAAVKLPENQLSPAVQETWEEYLTSVSILPMNERYSSQVYLSIAGAAEEGNGVEEEAAEFIPGYAGPLRILDENRAVYAIQIPGNVGRDGYDMEFRRDESGRLWLYQSNGAVYMEEAAVPTLYASGNSGQCSILPDGYARWYHVGSTAAGKTMTVRVPENAGFWVYGEKGAVTASSVLWGDDSAVLPKDGVVVFAGDPGATFDLTFSDGDA